MPVSYHLLMADQDGPSTLPPIPAKGFDQRLELHGRCISCGFLAKHSSPGKRPSTYFEIETAERAEGNVFTHTPDAFGGPVLTSPICFRGAFALGQEVIEESKLPDVGHERAAFRVFLKNRRCAKWFIYTPGLSPQQHLGGLAAQELEQRQYQFQQEMEDQRKKWERQIEDERRKFDIALAVIVGLLAAAEIAATVVGIFFT